VQESVVTLQSPETRRAVVDLARTHGFTHVAIEAADGSAGRR
jgi:hypothetical protein